MNAERKIPGVELPTNIPDFPDRIIRQAAVLTPRNTPTEVFTGVTKHEPITPPPTIFATRTAENTALTTESTMRYMSAGISMSWADIPADVVKDVLQQASDEIGRPASMLRTRDFYNRFDLLGQHSLAGLYSHAQDHETRQGRPIIPFLLENAGITTSANDVADAMRSGLKIQWEQVPPEALKGVLDTAGEELGIPASMLQSPDLIKPLEYLGGKSLAALRYFRQGAEDKQEKDVITRVHEYAGIEITSEDVTTMIRRGRRMYWDRVPGAALKGLLEQAAAELEKPAFVLDYEDFRKKFDFLEGNTLHGLRQHVQRSQKRDGIDSLAYLFEKAGIIPTDEDVIQAMQLGINVKWEYVPGEALHGVFERVAQQLGKPAFALGIEDLRRSYEVLGGRSLGGLISREQREKVDTDRTVQILLTKSGVVPTLADVTEATKLGIMIQWDRVPTGILKEILEQAAIERGKPASMLTSADFRPGFNFLNGRSLRGLYEFINDRIKRQGHNGKTITSTIKDAANIPDNLVTPVDARKKEIEELFEWHIHEKGLTNVNRQNLMPWITAIAPVYERTYLNIERNEILNELFVFIAERFETTDNHPLSASDYAGLVTDVHYHIEKYVRSLREAANTELSFETRISKKSELKLGDTVKEVYADHPGEVVVFSQDTEKALKTLSPLQRILVLGITTEDYTFEEMVGFVKEKFGLKTNAETLQADFEKALQIFRGEIVPEDNN